ncbi:MAG: aquaporin-like protein [Piptocephalis tieghemiana]|nr:MAG: aquaporin-like protein [Piptocephalis tieghemiana]
MEYREYLAEFIGMFILILLGSGASAIYIYEAHGPTFPLDLACTSWGLAIMVSVYINDGVSGGHNSPAVTLAFACWRGFPWRKVPGYWFAQNFGAFCATGILYLMYKADLDLAFSLGHQTPMESYLIAAPFFTSPDPIRGNYLCFLSEAISTAAMLIFIFACIDRYNVPPVHCAPVAMGLAISGILAAFGSSGSVSLNPARDFGPRLLMFAAGYGKILFTANDGYAWVPVVAPFIGAVAGGVIYDIFIATGPDPEDKYDSRRF